MPSRVDVRPLPSVDARPELPSPVIRVQDGQLSVEGPSNTIVEVVNTTTAPTGYVRLDDAFAIGKTDTSGRFFGHVNDAAAGDRLRIRARTEDGRVSPWIRVQLTSTEPDPRAAFVNLQRARIDNEGSGAARIVHDSRLPLTEYDALLRFTNTRTGAFVATKANEFGGLTEPVEIEAQEGDVIQVAVSDGVGNLDFSAIAGELTVPAKRKTGDIPDPPPMNRHRDVGLSRFTGPLISDIARPDEVKQGQIPNCYVPAALAAVAGAEPEAIREMIKDHGDGSYTVRFYDTDGTNIKRPVYIPVDNELYAHGLDPIYERNIGRMTSESARLWVPLVGKAFAAWKGSYEVVSQGGSVGWMLSAILGRPNTEVWMNMNTPDAVWEKIVKGVQEGRAMAAGTHGTRESARYSGSGIYANHAYSIHGAFEEDGKRYVILRNPWGNSEPGNDGRNDGIFPLEIERFHHLYQVLNIC